jgi:hypothetical protein
MAKSDSLKNTFALYVSAFILLAAQPAFADGLTDMRDCIKQAGVNSYNYAILDRFGRIGPYQLTARDLQSVGVCLNNEKLYGMITDWSMCDFKGIAAKHNGIGKVEHMQISPEAQDLYASVRLSQLYRKYGQIINDLPGLEGYKSYPTFVPMMISIIYRKGIKAVEYHAMFNGDVLNDKGKTLVEQMEIIKQCQVMKNTVQKPQYEARKWLNVDIVKDQTQLNRIKWQDPDEKTADTIEDLLYKDTRAKEMFGKPMLTSNPRYRYSKLDINLDGKDDYIVKLKDQEYQFKHMTYYLVFYAGQDMVRTFPAYSVYYMGDRLVVNGYILND